MKTVLELVSQDQHHHLLSVQDVMERTPLHSACEDDSSAVVLEVIMRLVTSEQTRYKLLQLTDMRGFTPLHNANNC